MSFFNALYTLGGCRRTQPISEDSKVTIEVARRTPCAKFTSWAKWGVTYPLSAVHSVYNIFLMAKCREIHEPVIRQIYEGNAINFMPMSIIPRTGQSFHIVSSPRVIQAITSHYRDDPHGVFQGKVMKNFLPLLYDLFPKDQASREDFLFTCSRDNVEALRNPLIEFIGPRPLPHLRSKLNQVTREFLDWLAQKEVDGTIHISARELTESFTVAVLARLFLDHPGTFKDFQTIGNAATFVLNFQLIRVLSKPTSEQILQYENALTVLRSAIESCSGEFPESLRNSGLSDISVKGTLLLVYVAGSETTSSALQYILWRLGQHPDHQEEIVEGLDTSSEGKNINLENFVSECLRLYTPASLFTRYAGQDLAITVKNKEGKDWQYPILKGEGIMCSPFLAGRNAHIFDSPDTFKPHRFNDSSNPHPTKVFSGHVHSCPGQWLARAEMSSLLSALLQKYTIASSPNKKELSMKGFTTLKVEEVALALHNRRIK